MNGCMNEYFVPKLSHFQFPQFYLYKLLSYYFNWKESGPTGQFIHWVPGSINLGGSGGIEAPSENKSLQYLHAYPSIYSRF